MACCTPVMPLPAKVSTARVLGSVADRLEIVTCKHMYMYTRRRLASCILHHHLETLVGQLQFASCA